MKCYDLPTTTLRYLLYSPLIFSSTLNLIWILYTDKLDLN